MSIVTLSEFLVYFESLIAFYCASLSTIGYVTEFRIALMFLLFIDSILNKQMPEQSRLVTMKRKISFTRDFFEVNSIGFQLNKLIILV